MKARVLVTSVGVEVLDASGPTDNQYVSHQYVPTGWYARGIVMGSGQLVTWSKYFSGHDVMPMPGSYVEVELEPDAWRVVQ